MPLQYINIMDITQIHYEKLAVLSRKLTLQESDSSNRIVEITKSMVAFKIDLFELTSRKTSPKRRSLGYIFKSFFPLMALSSRKYFR